TILPPPSRGGSLPASVRTQKLRVPAVCGRRRKCCRSAPAGCAPISPTPKRPIPLSACVIARDTGFLPPHRDSRWKRGEWLPQERSHASAGGGWSAGSSFLTIQERGLGWPAHSCLFALCLE